MKTVWQSLLHLEEMILILKLFIMAPKGGIRDEILLLASKKKAKMLIVNTFINSNYHRDLVRRRESFIFNTCTAFTRMTVNLQMGICGEAESRCLFVTESIEQKLWPLGNMQSFH